ncbi:uncharacterized protein FA14DRAFT_25992 [Meira miltonrushii]|uniref:Uncharacterized protein n=1 Tax=Meira miltonrushii TaxID=1280837 RepID=A0A316VPJ6_9BASI|nr:uncharacterized protein FA14DRAFT_25992 [Meira miltonrushii]PWN38343.1 hypothetical protein FA14DRAFT_25992 [Meira miltonrushii]
MRTRYDTEMLIMKLGVQLRKPINFDDEDGAIVDHIEDEKNFDQMIEDLLKKNEQLQRISQSVMSGQVKATEEAFKMTLGLQKSFEEALKYYDTYIRRIQATVEHREQNRAAYLNELQAIRNNFVKDANQGQQKHEELTDKLLQETAKILKHKKLSKVEEIIESAYVEMGNKIRSKLSEF